MPDPAYPSLSSKSLGYRNKKVDIHKKNTGDELLENLLVTGTMRTFQQVVCGRGFGVSVHHLWYGVL
ncbi:hypothetical protein [Halolamina salina]|uniref:Transposase n=1 Tax=Halolamina salina TaxID=1220023 RepID=A0ABD6B2H8_9EURY